jgi:hypothetical protein
VGKQGAHWGYLAVAGDGAHDSAGDIARNTIVAVGSSLAVKKSAFWEEHLKFLRPQFS